MIELFYSIYVLINASRFSLLTCTLWLQEHSKLYDFRPKYSRAKILHNLLWYLVYNYPRDSKPLSHTVEGGETDAPLAQSGTPPTGFDDIGLRTQSVRTLHWTCSVHSYTLEFDLNSDNSMPQNFLLQSVKSKKCFLGLSLPLMVLHAICFILFQNGKIMCSIACTLKYMYFHI